MAGKRVSPERRYEAEQMLRSGASRTATAKATGISPASLSRWFPDLKASGGRPPKIHDAPTAPADRPEPSAEGTNEAPQSPPVKPRPDPAPRVRRGKASPRRAGPTDEQLESMVRKAAKAPAIPTMLWLHCDYCAAHFRESAGPLAAELVAVSHEDQDLRDILVWMYSGWKKYAWAGMLASWLGIPILHHAAPGFVYKIAAPLMGMPPREPDRHAAFHMPPASVNVPAPPVPSTAPFESWGAPSVNGVSPTPSPFTGMDTASIIDMAASLGIEVPPDLVELASKLTADEIAATEPVPEVSREQADLGLAAAAAEAAAAQTAALAADPDAE